MRAVALTDRIPLDLYGSQSTVLTGEGDDGAERSAPGQMGHVGAGYFDAMGVAILRGHGFSAGDMVAGGRAVVVSAEAARRLWPGRDPIGRRLRLGAGSAAWFDVVGVAANVKVQTLGEVPVPFAYRPLAARHTGLLRVVARVDGDPGLAAAWLRQDAESLDDRVAVVQSSTMADVLGVMLFPFRMAAVLGSLLGLFTLGLAGVGLYGATAFALSRRRRELAIRVALGASPRDIVRVVLGGGVAAVAAGLLVGLPIAFAAARLAGAWLFGVTPADAVAYASAAGVLAAAAALALLRPARRAIRLDPMSALRDE